jgi:hypothetical protein
VIFILFEIHISKSVVLHWIAVDNPHAHTKILPVVKPLLFPNMCTPIRFFPSSTIYYAELQPQSNSSLPGTGSQESRLCTLILAFPHYYVSDS